MFPWNIAKSAEAMFSRWVIKRACKFLLKKKLGQFILGDIDLNQLDVQLTAGTIQLSDLALNVDYLNQKFGAAESIIVKEGSIGSLLVTMPWKGKGCEIEVEELELVLAPCGDLKYQFGSQTFSPSQDGNSCIIHDSGRVEHEKAENDMMSASMDVHEGVKTIAKMVKWLLTSFHVKVKKLIVAFDSCLGENEKATGFSPTLVLQITEVQCGTSISEEAISTADAKVDNFLGLNRLTNFVKFQGAVLEFIQMDGVVKEILQPCASSNVRTPVVTGKGGGFSGTLKLSIPWKNGSLDIQKVDADAYIDPLELRFQPNTIKWFLFLWEVVKDSGKNSKDPAIYKNMESVYFNTTSHGCPSTLRSYVTSNDMAMLYNESSPSDHGSPMKKETVTDNLLRESQVISDWVPLSISKKQKDGTEEEPDFGASIEQFFECFDGMRNSQSALGNSGMWNWTCSVSSAITAVSNLASGSLLIPSEQQHVETNLKATVAGISVLFSVLDQHNSSTHYLGAKLQDMFLVLRVCPQEMNFQGTVEYIELNDHFTNADDAMKFGSHACNDIDSQMLMIQQMQAAVELALPPFSSTAKDAGSEKPNGSVAADFPFAMSPMDKCISKTNCKGLYRDDVVKVTLLRTSGGTQCQCTVNSSSSDDDFIGPTSFSVKLPPFVFWVNFHLINMVLGLLKEVGSSFKMDTTGGGSASNGPNGEDCSSSLGEVKRSSRPYLTTLSPEEHLRGNIFLPDARVILCFPFESDGDFRSYCSWNQFIALDFTSPSTLSEENFQVTTPIPNTSSQRRTSCSLHLNMGNLDIYLITSASNSNVESNFDGIRRQKFFAENILCATNRRGHLSVISMLWQEGQVTDPWIAERAKLLAASKDSRGRSSFVRKGYEFASVTTAENIKNLSDLERHEMTLNSSFFVHAYLSPVKINLSSSQYKCVHHLLLQSIDGLSCVVHEPISIKNDSVASQTSILVECDSAEISVSLEMVESKGGSIQSELPGSWHHLKLHIKKFQMLLVSNIGGVCGANFLWVSHGEGCLWGSITGVPNKEFLLISCNNSTMGRGDGEGSNALSSKFSGSDIIHSWDPKAAYSHMCITVRCGTIVAAGGRLDWLDALSSFFSLPSPESDQARDDNLKKGSSAESVPCESSFVLNLVDVGLSYEPYLKCLMFSEVSDSESSLGSVNEGNHRHHVACLLAASSLKLSNYKLAGCVNSDYHIRVQDIGLLLSVVPGPENVGGTYSAEHLHRVGYVKIAREALVEAYLRIDCENDLLWELKCSESHIFLDTCHDTTSGLINLIAQLQQLFSPDVEESVVYLQTRWNNVKKAQESDGTRISSGDSAPSTSQVNTSHLDTKSDPGVINLMDEICEDAFHLDGHWDGLSDSSESQFGTSVDYGLPKETCSLNARNPTIFPHNLSLADSVPLNVTESSQPSLLQESFPEFIEGYFLTELLPLSKLSQEKQSPNEIPKYKSRNMAQANVEKVNNGWYEDSSLKILEDHVSDVSIRTGPQQLVADEATTSNCNKIDDCGKVRGRVCLKNINVIWRMYAGSDWHKVQKNVQHSPIIRGRDRTVCLELALSGMDLQYEIYPDGETFVSRISVSVQDFHLNDNSRDAPWKRVVGYYQSKDHPRKSSSKAFRLSLEAVRPDPLTPLEEYRLHIAFLPMLLHLHQSQLDFLISFFGGNSMSADQTPNAPQDMSEPEVSPEKSSNFGGHTISEEALLPYFQKFDMWPVLVRVDYIPCHVDLAALSGGKYVELVNLVPWKGIELQLKHVHAVGVYGWSSVFETIIGEWLEDISQNQIHKLLRGLPPIRSLVAVGSGTAKLVSLPVKNYRKDHRLLKGMQRGTMAFLRSLSLEAVGLGVHLAAGTHDILLQAEYILGSIPPSVPLQSRRKTNVRSNQPKNAKQGIQQACESISDGLGKTASALVRTPLKRYQRGAGAGSAFASAVQAAPAAVIAPASATARALHCALLGVRNSLDPEHKKESIEKYMGATQPREHITEG
ncbi:autophagy-related protein 2-like isoform X2 [Actinidia eriantha]|uniref:autophagy-related protein 2-like isoform X2 n=1 Tax=Actinidia eriantha TaxID=165200 RepID=UPI0025861646|nr:autophagy-related protein 2-like isoform X2 [Actinidia eriantha]